MLQVVVGSFCDMFESCGGEEIPWFLDGKNMGIIFHKKIETIRNDKQHVDPL